MFFGATVTYLRNGEREETVRIVGIDEVDPLAGRISWISPVAKALLKAREGDVVSLRTPAGVDELEVAVEIRVPGCRLHPGSIALARASRAVVPCADERCALGSRRSKYGARARSASLR